MTPNPLYEPDREVQPATYSTEPSNPPNRNRTWVIILIVAGLLLICCCVVLVIAYYTGDSVLEWLNDLGYDIYLHLPPLR